MIKSWDKFNEDITSITKADNESRYQKYKSTYIKLVQNNIPQHDLVPVQQRVYFSWDLNFL